ncbi:MAG: hypothetical protein CFE43_01255 [Burkholderiales bacterium PBB3]|nr:MAG: hypothetical protein CFE43_01255 [Burkholderiales bacterium PBB3]
MSIALHDGRPFFEKALAYGIAHGLLGPDKLEAINADAPKGMVQIARYFGTEFLRPELERARERMVNLVSLYLESSCNGDLQQAAESLRDHSFLSRSKGGSDMLKALIAMPQNSHFGMNERSGFTDDQIPVLAKWALRTLPEYQAELALRSQVATVVDAAIWLANEMGVDADALEEAGKDAEAVIRTALLVHAAKRTELPDWPEFEKVITALRKKHGAGGKPISVVVPKDLPTEYREIVGVMRNSVEQDLAKILDATLPVRKLFDQTPAFMGRYFWLEDALAEVEHFERTVSATWAKVTGGHSDDSTLLTLFLTVAAGSTPKTLLTEKSATTLVRKIRKSGLKTEAVKTYIAEHAPLPYQDDYTQLWDNFLEDALSTLQSDMDYALNDALALLRRECNISV